MLLIILGAGASYDSVPSRRPAEWPAKSIASRPPLSDELFDDRPLFSATLAQFQECLPVVPYLRHLGSGHSVESVLARLWDEQIEHPARAKQLAAIRYYLHMMLWDQINQWNHDAAQGVTNYKTLLDQVDRWRRGAWPVIVVTFNYDLMIDEAFPTVGVNLDSVDAYVANRAWNLFKLHGSVNWGREVSSPLDVSNRNAWAVASELIRTAASIDLSDRYFLSNERPVAILNGKAAIPAIAIPLAQKKTFECPPAHVERLVALLPAVTHVLIVGWRAADVRFLTLVRQHAQGPLRVLAVCGSLKTGLAVRHKFVQAGIRTRWTNHDGGFSEFTTTRAGDDFLNSVVHGRPAARR